ncbi:MAG: TIGR02266 family protein [Deltaproteobacteria bacterium]|nr:TIGR02266 family protein [Deltaproteobacteria bacterium]
MEGMPNSPERIDARVPVTLIVEYEGAGELVEDYSTNLSVGGTFVHTQRHMAKGTKVELVLSFPGLLEPIHLNGVVRWSSRGSDGEPNGVGIEFVGHDDLARARLRSVIEAIERGDSKFVGRVMKVLLVEENRHLVGLIRSGLNQASRRSFATRVAFEFDSRFDGQAALDALDDLSFRYDAMIIDMSLPLVGGARVVEQARAEPVHSNTPVVAVVDSDAAADEARQAGCHYLLSKPVRLRQLTAVMAQLMSDFKPRSER